MLIISMLVVTLLFRIQVYGLLAKKSKTCVPDNGGGLNLLPGFHEAHFVWLLATFLGSTAMAPTELKHTRCPYKARFVQLLLKKLPS